MPNYDEARVIQGAASRAAARQSWMMITIIVSY
jgi:hypothetical protein